MNLCTRLIASHIFCIIMIAFSSSFTEVHAEEYTSNDPLLNSSGRHSIQTGVSVSSGIHLGYKYNISDLFSCESNLGYANGAILGRFGFFSTGLNHYFFNKSASTMMTSVQLSYINNKPWKRVNHLFMFSALFGIEEFITSHTSVRLRAGCGWVTNAGRYDSAYRVTNIDFGFNFYVDKK